MTIVIYRLVSLCRSIKIVRNKRSVYCASVFIGRVLWWRSLLAMWWPFGFVELA
ncbi:hypothetical protein BREU_2139 [Bifidobacterium reuteri DSM 23975]|uniref:Uncharacterized protein n=1 Tax=Bifidobacterium reuteri DSM 23975 TaxID=1437610 RepID=A0A087CL03_9BIFI|nr:hypothetical protein BREU_2139 [Bifidobacterium reuteri DSM 23975]